MYVLLHHQLMLPPSFLSGGLIFYSAYPYSNFSKCPLHCSWAKAFFTVSSVSVIDLQQCISQQFLRQPSCFIVFLSSSWVVRGQKMWAWSRQCHLHCQIHNNNNLNLLPLAIKVKVFLCTKTWGGLSPPNFCLGVLWTPPAQRSLFPEDSHIYIMPRNLGGLELMCGCWLVIFDLTCLKDSKPSSYLK